MLRWVGLRRRILGDGGDSGNAATGAMSPNPGQPGQTVTVTPGGGLGGAGFGTGTGTVVIGDVAATVSSWTASLLTFVVPVQTTYPILLPLVVTTTTGETAGTDYTTVYPAITTLSQTSGQPGSSLTLTGTNFGASAGTVTIAGLAATVTAWSATSVTVTVPATGGGSGTYPDAGSVILTTTYGNAATAAQTYTITAPNPTIVHVQQPLATNVSSGDYGSDVYLIGTLFGTLQGTGGAKIHGHAATIVSWSDPQIRLTVPAEASYPDASTIVVTTGGALVSPGFAFSTLFPAITSMSVTTGQPGSSLTLTGSDFKAAQGAGSVTIAGIAAAVTAWSDTSVTVTVPSAGGTSTSYPDTGAVLLVNNSGSPASGPSNFTITAPNPVISSLSAASGVVGASLTLTGTFFGASQGAGGVTVAGTVATVTSWAETSVTITLPAQSSYPTTGSVVLTTNGALTTNGISLREDATPAIAHVQQPLSTNVVKAVTGTDVYLVGTGFYASQGGGGVTVHGVAATVVSWADTQVRITLPAQSAYPDSGNIVLTNSSSIASSGVSFETDALDGAAHFAGTNPHYCSCSSTAFNRTGDYSAAFWVKLDSGVTGATLLSHYDVANEGWYVDFAAGTVQLWSGNSGTMHSSPGVALSTNAWHLVVVSYKASNATLYISVDGAAFVSAQNFGAGSYTGLQPFIIAALSGTGSYLAGAMDEIGYWSRLFSGTELALLWNGGAGVNYTDISTIGGNAALLTNLVAYWDCDDGTGQDLADATGNGHTLLGANGASTYTNVPGIR